MHEWDEGMRSHILPVSHQQAPQTLLSRPSCAIPALPSEFLCADDFILLPPVSASAHHVSYSFVIAIWSDIKPISPRQGIRTLVSSARKVAMALPLPQRAPL